MIAGIFKAYKEIFDQGRSLELTYKYITGSRKKIIEFFAQNEFHDIVFVACGSSYWLSLSASMSFSEVLNRPCYALKSGDILLNDEYYKNLYNKPLVIAPSRSGSTTETLNALDFFKQNYNSPVISSDSCCIEADYFFPCNFMQPETIAMFGVFVMQGFAYYTAIRKGLNPDKPGNLVQWIKIETV